MDRPRTDVKVENKTISDRTGTIGVSRYLYTYMDDYSGYERFIYGSKREDGRRDRVKIVAS